MLQDYFVSGFQGIVPISLCFERFSSHLFNPLRATIGLIAQVPEADSKESSPEKGPIDYAPLRRLVLEGVVNVGKIKIADTKMKDLRLKISGKNGVFKVDPFNMGLYQGDVAINGVVNVKEDTPVCNLKIKAKDILSNPLVKDVLEKDLLDGKLNADLTIQTRGDNAHRIKETLNGKGNLFINDGAVLGIDLVSMVRNTDGAYGFADRGDKKRRTEFSEFKI